MTALYSELDQFCCDWLANLQAAGHIAPGRVLCGDFRDYVHTWGDHSRIHFFAGLGGWDLALQIAGWPDDAPVWTGSCPCQPFSTAGRRKGVADDRHLWPDWFKLIQEHMPPIIFGEQVGGSAGRTWFDLVSADLEGAGYAVGAADLPACSVGAPHIRQRLYFVALAGGKRCEGVRLHLRERRSLAAEPEAARRAAPSTFANTKLQRSGEGRPGKESRSASIEPDRFGTTSLVGHTSSKGGGRDTGAVPCSQRSGESQRHTARDFADKPQFAGAVGGPWSGADWLYCRDGKYRPVEPGTFPLARGTTSRVGRLRAYGNAIVPQVAAQFIGAVMEYLQQ